ncbi:beta-glucosidase D [Thozetella sp. PMI_491]|nr:beta-glucosidase D [Thozetella sp. PMI_491]
MSLYSAGPELTVARTVALGEWQTAYNQAVSFLADLTLAQKAAVVTGKNATNSVTGETFPGVRISDGQQGPNSQYFVTGWGQPLALAMTFDREAIYQQARSVGVEYYTRGYNVVDGPTSSPMGRTPWSGRLPEGMGFDPYLNGIVFGTLTKAQLDVGVLSSGKHFLLNEQETDRMNAASNQYNLTAYSSNVDDKTLHETYLFPWYDAVKNGLATAMCAMNAVNGTYSCENKPLLTGLLKGELGFPGFVVPDISGQRTTDGSANGGLDWASDQKWSPAIIEDLVTSGKLSTERLDDMVIRNIIGWYRANLNNGSFPSAATATDYREVPNIMGHRALNRLNGAKSMVLLKNKNNALPLKTPRTMSLFGAHAGPAIAGPNIAFSVSGVQDVFSGHMATPGGSGNAPMPYLVSPLEALSRRAAADNTEFRWILADNYTATGGGFSIGGTATVPSIKGYAADTEACLVFLNAWSGEGKDRAELRNDGQDQLVLAVASQCKNTIVVINSVGPRVVDAWVEHDNVTAVLFGGPLGQESGNSIVDVLYGDYNPSGRLAFTIAKAESDYVAPICRTVWCDFTEGNYIDYRHFDKSGISPRYEFGFGLSYTTFKYDDINVASNATGGPATGEYSVGGRADLWDTVASITFSLQNTGSLGGAEIPQLYLSFPDVADQPIRQLRGFESVYLGAGESTSVTMALRRRDISYWNVTAQEWTIAKGNYTVHVGASSRDMRLSETFVVSSCQGSAKGKRFQH